MQAMTCSIPSLNPNNVSPTTNLSICDTYTYMSHRTVNVSYKMYAIPCGKWRYTILFQLKLSSFQETFISLPYFRTSIFLQAKTVARILQDPITAFSGGSSKPGWSWPDPQSKPEGFFTQFLLRNTPPAPLCPNPKPEGSPTTENFHSWRQPHSKEHSGNHVNPPTSNSRTRS